MISPDEALKKWAIEKIGGSTPVDNVTVEWYNSHPADSPSDRFKGYFTITYTRGSKFQRLDVQEPFHKVLGDLFALAQASEGEEDGENQGK